MNNNKKINTNLYTEKDYIKDIIPKFKKGDKVYYVRLGSLGICDIKQATIIDVRADVSSFDNTPTYTYTLHVYYLDDVYEILALEDNITKTADEAYIKCKEIQKL